MAIVTLGLFVALLVIAICYLITKRDKINLPGPKPWPVIGNAFQLLSQQPWYYFDQWAKKYNGLFIFYFFQNPVVVASTYEAIHEVLVKRGKEFSGRGVTAIQCSPLGSGPHLEFGHGRHLLRLAQKKELKNVCSRLKHGENTGNMEFGNVWQAFESHAGQPFSPEFAIRQSVSVTSVTAMVGSKGAVSEELFSQLVEVANLGMDLFKTFGHMPEMNKFRIFLPFNSRVRGNGLALRKSCKTLLTTMETEYKEDSQEGTSVLKAMYGLYSQGLVNKTELQQTVVGLLFGSGVSTLPSLVMFINYLGYYTHFASKIQDEVDRVIGDRAPSAKDRPDMPYTRATIFELLRLQMRYAPPHFAVEDTCIGDVKIPRGTEVILNMWTLMHDDSLYPEPYVFRPERFLDSSGELLPPNHEIRKRFMPFSAGPNACVGEVLALDRLFLFLTSLVQRFEVQLPERKLYCNPCDQNKPISLYYPPEFKVQMVRRQKL